MSLLLIVISSLLVAALYWRIVSRSRSAIRQWAHDYGYRVESARFHAAFSADFREAGQEAEMVYRVVLSTVAGERNAAYFLLWNVLAGRLSVVVRWVESPPLD